MAKTESSKRLCKDLVIDRIYPLREQYRVSIYNNFKNWEATISKFVDETPPGCSCADARLLISESVKLFHPSFIVDCQACSFYLSWKERMEIGDRGSVYALEGQAFMEIHCFECQLYETCKCPGITAETIKDDKCPAMIERSDDGK